MKFHAAFAVALLANTCTPSEPAGLTFFSPSHEEERLLGMAAAYEAATKQRQAPSHP